MAFNNTSELKFMSHVHIETKRNSWLWMLLRPEHTRLALPNTSWVVEDSIVIVCASVPFKPTADVVGLNPTAWIVNS